MIDWIKGTLPAWLSVIIAASAFVAVSDRFSENADRLLARAGYELVIRSHQITRVNPGAGQAIPSNPTIDHPYTHGGVQNPPGGVGNPYLRVQSSGSGRGQQD